MGMRPNNNPKNKKSLLDFQRRQLELSKMTENDAKKMKIESNIEKWEDSLPKVLKIARPNSLPKELLEKIKTVNLKPPYDKQILISSNNPTVSTFASYAILNGLIRAGIVIPSEIRKTSLLDGYNNINGMFNARKWKDYFFDKKAKVLLIEGCSKSLTYMGPKGEDQFWKELNDFTRTREVLVIVNYNTDDVEKEKALFIPALTNDSELNSSIIKKTAFIQISEKEENDIETKQAQAYRSL